MTCDKHIGLPGSVARDGGCRYCEPVAEEQPLAAGGFTVNGQSYDFDEVRMYVGGPELVCDGRVPMVEEKQMYTLTKLMTRSQFVAWLEATMREEWREDGELGYDRIQAARSYGLDLDCQRL